ncbi:MAG: 50S ribosomal protein L25 [Candidatus Nanopelagicales bacterium]|nr:50S ribosomal protein L25 [Candidatus Nanopelagicales bacterium]
MSTDVRIAAQARTDFGKGAARRYRRAGHVPAVMYGSGSDVRHVLLPDHELNLALRISRVVLNVELDGESLLVAPRDIQRNPVRQDLKHVDLIILSAADVADRHAYAQALAKARAAAEEAGFDQIAVAAIIEEASAKGEDLDEVASRIVETLEERAKAREEATAAAEAREEAIAAAEALEEGETAGEPSEEAGADASSGGTPAAEGQ